MSKDNKIIPFPEGGRNEALRRIRVAAESGQTVLDLGDLSLDSLPGELRTLTQLRHLSLGRASLEIKANDRVIWCTELERKRATLTDLSPLSALTHLRSLDLSYASQLRDLAPLSPLSNLEQLNLYGCISITEITPLANLRSLAVLSLAALPLSEISPLADLDKLEHLSMENCRQFSNLEPLANIKSLSHLYVKKCPIWDVHPLTSLPRLTQLSLEGCDSVFWYEPLAECVRLKKLNLSGCKQLVDIAFVSELRDLEQLDLSGCRMISDLSPLADLVQLRKLDISECAEVDSIEPLARLLKLTALDLSCCSRIRSLDPLYALDELASLHVDHSGIDVPDYLAASGDAPSILAWRQGTVGGVGPSLSEIKLLLVGQGRVGKSHLRRRISGESTLDFHDGRLELTQSVDRVDSEMTRPKDHSRGAGRIHVRFWDFGGQNHLHSSHRFFLGGERCFYLLVIAADRPANGEGPESNRLNYWLRMIAWYGRTTYGERAPVVIVVTRCDEPSAAANRASLDAAVQAAERHGWFGANVLRVVRGFGWSRTLDPDQDQSIWERHSAATEEILSAIDDGLAQVPGIQAPVPVACRKAKEFIESSFLVSHPSRKQSPLPYMFVNELDAIDELHHVPPGPTVEDQKRGLRHATLGLLSSLGTAFWIGNRPEIIRRNPWGLQELVFNPEWVKRPVYDLLWRADPRAAQTGFLTDRQVQEVLTIRLDSDPHGADLYEQAEFTEQDRGRVLELMKACRLIFDSPHGPGILIPDLLETARLEDDEVIREGWRYSAEFLPEKIMLRFIAQQYRAIDTRAGHCFRNRVIWRRGEHEVLLEAYFSPSGGTRPYVLIRPVSADEVVPETIAMSIGLLFDEIFMDEGLGEVRQDLRPAGESRSEGQYVFRKLLPTGRGAKANSKFSIIFDGVNLGSNWRFLTGLEYLHTLIRCSGEPCYVRDLAPDDRTTYRFQQDAVERAPEVKDQFRKKGQFADYSTKRLKTLLEVAKDKLVRAAEKGEDERECQKYELQVEELTYEIERRDNPEMKKLMNTAQQHLKRAVDELKKRMQENGIPVADLEHFDHCTSSGSHPFHFCYRPAISVDWETD